MDREKAIRIVKKLLALGDKKRNSSKSEALNAVEKARAIMDKFDISMGEISFEKQAVEEEAFYCEARNGKRMDTVPHWVSVLAHGIGWLNDTRFYVVRGTRAGRVVFYGYPVDVRVSENMLSTLVDLIFGAGGWRDRALVEYKVSYCEKGSRSDSVIFARTYLNSIAMELSDRMKNLAEARKKNVQTYALVLKKDVLINKYEKTLHLRRTSRCVNWNHSSEGERLGKRDGTRISLVDEVR